MTLRQTPLALIQQLQQLPTVLEARRSTIKQKRVVVTYIINASPTSHMTKAPCQAQPSNDAPPTIPHTTQLHHNHNVSRTLAPALCATHQQTNTHLTTPQHYPTTLQPSYTDQTRRPNGQCLQPKPARSERTCQRIHRWVLFTQLMLQGNSSSAQSSANHYYVSRALAENVSLVHLPPPPIDQSYHHRFSPAYIQNLSSLCIPALILGSLNAKNLWDEHWEHWEHLPPLEERVEYPYMNIRTKAYPWGNGDEVCLNV